ncbi:HIT domain-containing protein [Streptomyces sp. TRM66268-LWL]|uniref:HIT domain-containing protein n=1 Tax=Streptomyces polyasparticus TaxID=2767826 RepID=A0ABR7SU52_9ACTN|nr:HIT domain-containing protein [Streptomyces polyasparticus]MBC9718424.1 HIT domain-containing protein [Streptomyces polyasparticus]
MAPVEPADTVSDFYCHQALAGLVDLDVVAETETTLAFHHTRPSYPVHIVVIPKEHTPSLTDLGRGGPQLLAEVLETVRKVAQQVEAEHGACSVTTNLGLYQESKHLHWHVTYRGESEAEILAMYGNHDA